MISRSACSSVTPTGTRSPESAPASCALRLRRSGNAAWQVLQADLPLAGEHYGARSSTFRNSRTLPGPGVRASACKTALSRS